MVSNRVESAVAVEFSLGADRFHIMVLALIFVASAALAYFVHRWYTVWQYSEAFPGPKWYPIVGNALQMGNNPYDYMQNMVHYAKKYAFQPFRVWIGNSLYVVLTDPKDVEIMLSTQKHNDKFDDYRFLHDWIGTGLITATSTPWFRQRRTITPTFHFNILHDFHITMSANLEKLMKKIDEYALSGEAFDAQHLINMATLDLICETAMGVQVNALEDQDSELVKAFHDASVMVYKRIFSWWKRFDLLWPLSKDYKTNRRAVDLLRSFNQTIITQRKQQLEAEIAAKSTIDANDNDVEKPRKRIAFLDMLLTTTVEGRHLTDQEIGDEVSTFMFAGHDTTAAAIAIAMYNMAINPAEQQQCLDEQLSMFGEDLTLKASYQQLQEMKYLEMFIKESQRMHPAVNMIGRRANEGLVLANGQHVPKDTSVAIFLYSMGQNPALFPEPERFDPTRFLPENRAQKNPYEYVPFSAGARNCIGQKFANNELRLVLGAVVRHFELLPVEVPFEPMFASTATTHSDNGIWMRAKRRQPAK